MQNKIFQNVAKEAVEQIDNLTVTVKKASLDFQKTQIAASSPFSVDINDAFAGYDEFSYLLSLGLREAMVTRRSLVKEIDFDLYVTEKKRTNYELMKQGYAPYAKDDKQRYKCNSCSKVFPSTYSSIIEGCSFSLSDWVKFIDCLYNGYSVEKTAELCGISKKAAFDNRSRLFFALDMLEEKVMLEGNVAIDETYIHESSKGNRKLQKGFSMSRAPRKRGSENHTRGLSKNQVCIACALDEYGVSIAKVAGLGAPSAKRLEDALGPHINADRIKLLHSDASNAIRCFANRNNLPIQQSQRKKPGRRGTKGYETVRQIQRINAYHSRLKKFLEGFNGVSSDNLQGYVSLFSWRDRNREREPVETYKELLAEMVLPNKYIVLIEQTKKLMDQSKEVEKRSNRRHFQNERSEEKTKKIYELYVAGVPVKEIAEKFGCSSQAVTRRIRNYRSLGLGRKTQKEIDTEEAAKQQGTKEAQMVQRFIKQGEYYDQLLAERQAWSGEPETFYDEAVKR